VIRGTTSSDGRGVAVERLARLDVEEVEVSRVNGEYDLPAFAPGTVRAYPRDEVGGTLAFLFLQAVQACSVGVRGELCDLVGDRGRRVDPEVKVRLATEGFAQLDTDRHLLEARVGAAGSEVLRADTEDDGPALIAGETGSRGEHLRWNREAKPSHGDCQTVRLPFDPRLDEVHRGGADEPGDKQVRRPLEHRLGRGDLLNFALAHDGDHVAERHRLDLIVGDVDSGGLELVLDPPDLGAHLYAELRVQVRERLVHQERLRLANDRPPHRHTLPLSARERAGFLVELVDNPQCLGRTRHTFPNRSPRHTASPQREGHVVVDGHVWVERVVLEHHRDVTVLRGHVVHGLAADANDALCDRLEAGDHAK
jgi:hypothetical protein